MTNSSHDPIPPEHADIVRQLRSERATATPLELDSIKLRAMSQARRRSIGGRGTRMRSRGLTIALTLLLIGGTTAGGLATAGGGSGGGNAASAQYRPGNGCGDKNHIHTGPPGRGTGPDCPNK